MRSWTTAQRWTFLFVVALALALRLHTFTEQPFWSDEWYTLKMVTQPTLIQDLLMILVTDIYPPLFYVFTWIGVKLGGEGIFFLRLGALLGSVAAVALVYTIARRWAGTRAALYAGLLAALSPMGVYYAQEFKLYSFFAATNLWVLYEALCVLDEEGRSWKRLAWATGVTMWTYYLAPHVLLPLFLTAAWAWRRGWHAKAKALFKGLFVGMLAALPLLPFFLKTVMIFNASFFDRGIHQLLWYTAQNFSTGFVISAGWAALAAGLFIVAVAYNLRSRMPKPWVLGVIVAVAVLPSALQWLQAIVWKPSYSDRAMLGTAYAWVLAAGIGLAWMEAWTGRVLLIAMLAINAYSLDLHYRPETRSRYDFKVLYDALKQDWRPGDAVFHRDIQSLFPFVYYARQEKNGMQNWQATEDPGFHYNDTVQGARRYWRPVNAWLTLRGLGIDSGLDKAIVFPPRLQEEALKGVTRLWYVAPSAEIMTRCYRPMLNLSRNGYAPYGAFDLKTQPWLGEGGFHLVSKGELAPGVELYRFERKEPKAAGKPKA